MNVLRTGLETNRGHRLLAIIGPSGSGKSSLAQAGLVAALRDGRLPGSQGWQVVHCRPGADPLESLSAALYRAKAIDLSEAGDLRRGMMASERALYYVTYEVSPERRLVLLVDQFEEIFALCQDEARRRAFIGNLLYAAGVTGGQTVVLLTLRADFYGHCASYGLSQVLPAHQVLVEPMTGDELRSAIQRPAYLRGRVFEAGLVGRLLDDVRDQAGGLPLLQHALLELWSHCPGQQLTHAAYEEIGGVAGALQRRAEMVYQRLSAPEKALCQHVFLRLTQPGEGMADTSRRATFAELLPVEGDACKLEGVVQKLADARLVTTGGDETRRSVEVAHEALIQGWRRLRAWIDEHRESLLFSRRLDQAAREWKENHRDASYLYWGTRLTQAELWAESHTEDLSALQQAFLTASQAARDDQRRRQADAESRRLAARSLDRLWEDRELALLLAIKAAQTADTPQAYDALRTMLLHRRTIRLVGHTGAVKHVSWDATGTRVATASVDGTARVWSLAPGSAGPLVPRGGRLDPAPLGSATPSPAGPLMSQEAVEPIRQIVLSGHSDEVWWVAWSKSQTRLATASDDGTARVWDAESGAQLAILAGHTEWVYHVAWSKDDARLVTAGGDGTARVWNLIAGSAGESACGAQPFFTADHRAEAAGTASATGRHHRLQRVVHAAWNRDGTRLVTACADGTARMWDAKTGTHLHTLRHDVDRRSSVYRVRWSPDDSRIVTASYDHTARVWDAETCEQIAVLAGHTQRVYYATWSPDGTRIATASADDTARIWSLAPSQSTPIHEVSSAGDAEDGSQVAVLSGHTNQVRYVAWNPAGTYVITVSDDGTARIWDARDGRELAVLQGHTRGVGHVSWNRAGTRFATASDDGTCCVWQVADIEQFVIQGSHLGIQDLLDAACERAARNMSREEWRQYVGDEPYCEIIPGKPVPGMAAP